MLPTSKWRCKGAASSATGRSENKAMTSAVRVSSRSWRPSSARSSSAGWAAGLGLLMHVHVSPHLQLDPAGCQSVPNDLRVEALPVNIFVHFLAYLLECIRLSDRSCKSGICDEVWRLRSTRFKNSIWRSENLAAADRPNLTPPIDGLGLCHGD
jgi:hypothetical protein